MSQLRFSNLLKLILVGSAMYLSACAPPKLFEVLQPQYKAQPDCGFVQNVYGERISWKDNLPISLSVHESVPKEYWSTIQDSLNSWEKVAGRKLFEVKQWGAPGVAQPRQDGVNMLYQLTEWESNKASEQARTSVYWVGDQIKEFDIRLNAKDFRFYVNGPQNALEVHLLSLLIHEVGHGLGLKHKDITPSVMGTYLASATVRDQITGSDRSAFACEYGGVQ